ncbi:MAG: TSUP family transporter [Alphaproteobacteria bacterium]|nr:TSUP family transporter [Alphaproteobacteria bacterium]
MSQETALLAVCMGLVAVLYASVGHGGASAYLALMAIADVPQKDMRTIALALNIFVAGLGAVRYVRAGRFDAQVFWPFAVTAIPVAFFAGRIELPDAVYRPLLATVLAAAAIRYLAFPTLDATRPVKRPATALAAVAGAALGALAGLTGTGGGIFLSPLLVFTGWARAAETTGIAACFIVANSAAGLAGRFSTLHAPPELPIFLACAVIGGLVGSTLSLRFFTPVILLRALGCVLAIAAAGLLFA